MRGLIAYSFALSEYEPNPCNQNIAREVERLVRSEKDRVVIVAQWEVAEALKIKPDLIIKKHRKDGVYLDSEEVTRQAGEFFKRVGVEEVIPVSQPFLQLQKCLYLVGNAGFIPVWRRIRRIGFYKKSLQWWTRGPVQLLVYSILQLFFGRRGR